MHDLRKVAYGLRQGSARGPRSRESTELHDVVEVAIAATWTCLESLTRHDS